MSDKGDDFMTRMQTIVRSESKTQRSYMTAQRKHLAELKRMKAAIERGEQVDISSVKKALEDSGIIDKNGNLKKRYRLED